MLFPPDLLGFWDPLERFLSRPSWKGSSSWPIPTWVGFVHVGNNYLGRVSPVAIPTQVRVPETNKHKLFFYVDDGRISGHNTIWVQMTLVAVARILKKVGL